ncbi:hypothetical protein [Lentzea albidocapillata]|uniref:Uncharacterized protein n=1 Tax=Lentzea albidocapillata TaxID=40571 RepID=A0A1W2FIA3_9PSEU|nr:hypothetical protein [Lentzea albidocapillata]SMD21426.1 hypothetical protein SAMN05660733_06383 [Lentzea albidocapillata]
MSWLRRLLLLAGLVTGAWLLGGAGEANADVRVEIDQLKVEVKLPVVDIGLKIATTPSQQPDAPVPPKPAPRVETPEPTAPQTPAQVGAAPVKAEVPQHAEPEPEPETEPLTTWPPNSVPVPQQPQPQAEQPIPGTLPQSGAGASAGSTQIPADTLPHAMRPPTTTASLVSTEQQDVPRIARAEEPTFSPD